MALSNGTTNGTTSDMEQITSQLQALGISKLPTFSGVQLYPQHNPVDVYRALIIEQLHSITGVDPAIVDNALQWTKDLKFGDLILPLPALRLKWDLPEELSKSKLTAKEKTAAKEFVSAKEKALVTEIVEKFDSSIVEKPTADGNTIKFFFKPEPYANLVLRTILQQKDNFGFNPSLGLKDPSDPASGRKKILVEFSSPNIAKQFHPGHLRSTIIGGFLIKLYKHAGWQTWAMNYLGDWGTQYGILVQGFEKYGSEEELQNNPIKHLNEVYVKINQDKKAELKPLTDLQERKEKLEKQKNPIKSKKDKDSEPKAEWNQEKEKELQDLLVEMKQVKQKLDAIPSIDEKARQFFAKMSNGDQDALYNWKRFRELSIQDYIGMYARLNIEFDEYSGESTVDKDDMALAAKVLEEKGVSEKSEGAVIVNIPKHDPKAKELGKALITKSDGTSLYATRDIAANFERYDKHHFDKMLYVVASQQDLHLAQCFKILELMGPPYSDIVAKCDHITFGMVKDPNGQTMSTRKGKSVSLADELDAQKDFMHERMKESQDKEGQKDKYLLVEDPEATADILGISAIMVQDYNGKRINDYNWDKEKMNSVEGDTGPYLQYSHARACSIERKFPMLIEQLISADFSLITTKEGIQLVRTLAQWPDVFINTYKTLEPVTVLTYLFKLTHILSTCYEATLPDNKRVKSMSVAISKDQGDVEKQAALMALYTCTRQVLKNGLELLGMKPVERM